MTWLHNWHAARESEVIGFDDPATPPIGTSSFGTRLDRIVGEGQVIIGNVTAPPERDGTRPDALGTRLWEQFGDRRVIVDFRHPPDEGDLTVFSVPGRLIAEPTAGMAMDGVVLRRHFDGVVYIPHSTYVAPR